MDFDTARLRAFVQVAERGTVAAAAAALGYTAPAVSQQVAKLEAQLGAPLFDRYGGRLRPSARGRALLPVALQLLDLADRATAPVTAPAPPAHVVIAGFASALRSVVVPLLAPGAAGVTTIEVREAEDDDALRDLRLGQIDVAIVQEYDGAPTARPARLDYTPLRRDRLRLLAPPAFGPRVRLADLADVGWLVNGAGTRCEAATQRVLRAAGIRPRITGRVGDNETLLALVAAGHGATIAPELVIGAARATVTVADVDLGAGRTIYGVTRAAAAEELRPLLALAAEAKAEPPAAPGRRPSALSAGRRRAAPRGSGPAAAAPPPSSAPTTPRRRTAGPPAR